MSTRYRLICIGRRAQDPLLAAADDYTARLKRYATFEVVRIKESGLEEEGLAIAERLPEGAHLVILDERGQEPTTLDLARRLQRWQELGREIVFVIGGADGIHADLKRRAHETLALSRLTLPHRLAQVLLLEQLYRAHTILRHEPYHRA